MLRTSLHVFPRESILQSELVDFIETMPAKDQILLALRFYDELTLQQICDLTDLNLSPASRRIKIPTERLVAFSLTRATSFELPKSALIKRPMRLSVAVFRWISRTYNTDVWTYLATARQAYREDVSYLVAMLDNGNGIEKQQGNQVLGDLAAETRLAMDRLYREGVSALDIAKRFELPHRTVVGYLHSEAVVHPEVIADKAGAQREGKVKLTPEKRAAILAAFDEGQTGPAIAKRYGVSNASVYALRNKARAAS
jgi:DNA-directed RNA polymerase specialized sigma24 family protein